MTDLPSEWLPLRSMQTGKTQHPKRLRQQGDTTPLRTPGVVLPSTTYRPDPVPALYPPMVARRPATSKELGRGALIVYNSAIRHGWLVDITYAYGYPPNEPMAVESFALRMSKDDRHAVAVWENGNVSCVYYWTGTQQPRKVSTTDLIGQRETAHRQYKKGLFDDLGIGDDRSGDRVPPTPRVPKQREGQRPSLTWSQLAEGDTIAAKDGSPWVIREARIDSHMMTFGISRPDGTGLLKKDMYEDRPVNLIQTAEEAAIAAFGDVEVIPEQTPTGTWLSELQIEKCRQLGVGCNHEVCRWDRQRRRRRGR